MGTSTSKALEEHPDGSTKTTTVMKLSDGSTKTTTTTQTKNGSDTVTTVTPPKISPTVASDVKVSSTVASVSKVPSYYLHVLFFVLIVVVAWAAAKKYEGNLPITRSYSPSSRA